MTVINNAHGIEIGGLLEAARLAGARILEVYGREFEIEYKGDDSPLTEADKESNEAIMAFLERDYPNVPVISEENQQVPYSERSRLAKILAGGSSRWNKGIHKEER